MNAAAAIATVEAFQRRHSARYEQTYDGTGAWTDGSMVASLLAMLWVEALVGNGGWHSVYYNQSQWAVPVALPGYHAIGAARHGALAQRAHDLVARAEAANPEAADGSEEWFSTRLMELVGDELDVLCDEWSEIERTEDIYTLMAVFIRDKNLIG